MKRVNVAVGVITNGSQILVAKRADHQHQGGLWEFPGGKIEEGESTESALIRELSEELGIVPTQCQPLIQINHDYSDKCVHLDVYWVLAFSGIPEGKEGQPLRWVAVEELSSLQFPKANEAILSEINKRHFKRA